jgi:hypothetical protein
MVQAGYHLRFTVEARTPDGVVSDAGRKNLDRDVAVQPGVARAIDLAHAASSDRRDDFVGPETIANSKGHGDPDDLLTLIVVGRDRILGKARHRVAK